MTTVTLSTNSKMPLVGLGTWKTEASKAAEIVYTAIKAGYRLIDCASVYANEKQVGEGIRRAISEGIVKREDLWITSKLWCTYHAKQNVGPACKRTLSDLGLDYLDLYLIHFPIALKFVEFDKKYPLDWVNDPNVTGCILENSTTQETWQGMEELAQSGICKNIGVSNYNVQSISDICRYAKIRPAVLQIENHIWLQQPMLINWCKEQGIAITAFSTFGGLSYIPLDKTAVSLLEDPTVIALSKKYSVTPAQITLRFAVQQNIAVIPKSSAENRLKENLNIFGFKLDDEDMIKLKTMDKNLRYNDPGTFLTPKIPIFT